MDGWCFANVFMNRKHLFYEFAKMVTDQNWLYLDSNVWMIEDLPLLMKNNKNQKGFGYGFGDALFGIKELQGNYDDMGKV